MQKFAPQVIAVVTALIIIVTAFVILTNEAQSPTEATLNNVQPEITATTSTTTVTTNSPSSDNTSPSVALVGYSVEQPAYVEFSYKNLIPGSKYGFVLCLPDTEGGGCSEWVDTFTPQTKDGVHKAVSTKGLGSGPYQIMIFKDGFGQNAFLSETYMFSGPNETTVEYNIGKDTITLFSDKTDTLHWIIANQNNDSLQLALVDKNTTQLGDATKIAGWLDIEQQVQDNGMKPCHLNWCNKPAIPTNFGSNWDFIGSQSYSDVGNSKTYPYVYRYKKGNVVMYFNSDIDALDRASGDLYQTFTSLRFYQK